MSDKIMENNQAVMTGVIISEFQKSYEVYGEGFYVADLVIRRLSGSEDRIPLTVSERLVNVKKSCVGKYVRVRGQFRSYNRHSGDKNRLVLSVFVRELEFIKDEEEQDETNLMELNGYICKPPVHRVTPLGRQITDILLAVNRPYGKSDYIPCICWGRNAGFASNFEIGGHLHVWGRIQSRDYVKKLDETVNETRTAYEVSVSRLEYQEAYH